MLRTLLWLAAFAALFGCERGDRAQQQRNQALAHFAEWTERARDGARDDVLCHGLGLLKHRQYTCGEMLAAAARPLAESRTISGFGSRDCFQDVCGTFYEFEVDSVDAAGNEIEETVVLKVDGERIQTYWFRSSTMLEGRTVAEEEAEDDGKSPEQLAYDRLVALYPSLYRYPPCYGVRASSSNLAGELTPIDSIEPDVIETIAQGCGESFCFGLVGQKIAPLCP